MPEPVAEVYVSCNMWVAVCPNAQLGCLGAEHAGRAPLTDEERAGLALRRGRIGGLTRDRFRCARCGVICRSVWPDNAEDIWFVLQQRPEPLFRSWNLGETLEDLIIENAAHGILPLGIERGPMRVLDGRLTDRSLLPAGLSFAIGA